MTSPLQAKTAALRRQHILDAAARCFGAAGYQRTTIKDIAKEAGVADGTIYNSFANKADLLLAMLDPLSDGIPAGSPPATEASLHGRSPIAALLAERWNALTPPVLDLLRVVLSEALVDRPLGEAFRERVLTPAIEPLAGAFQVGGIPDAELAARATVASFLGFAILQMLGDPMVQANGDALPERIANMLEAVTRTPQG